MQLLARLLTLFSLVAVFGCSQPEPVELPPPRVGVVTVLQAPIANEIRFTARTHSPQRIELQALVEGTLHKRLFEDGQAVARGDALFQIDARSPAAALAQARAELARAKVSAADAEAVAATNRELLDRQVIGREEYRQSQVSAAAAAALVKSQQAIVNSAALTRGFSTVVAPFDGHIGQAKVEIGSFVRPGGEPLAVLARVDPMYADFALSERQFLRLTDFAKQRDAIRARAAEPTKDPETDATASDDTAAEAPATDGARATDNSRTADPRSENEELNAQIVVALELADGSFHPYRGRLQLVSVEMDASTGTFPMRAIFPNDESLLVPGLYGRVVLRSRERHPALLIPRQALLFKQTGTSVYVLADDGSVAERRVELGQEIGRLVVVREGLAADELVVSEGMHKCRPGLLVDAVEAEVLDLSSDPLSQPLVEGPEGWYERFLSERRIATLTGG